MILVGHNIDRLRSLPAQSVHCVVTSPPYWGLRCYGTDPQTWGDGWVGELGSEPTPEMFVGHMVEVFAEVWRVLRNDGTCWVNLGDSYAGCGRGGNHPESIHKKQATNAGSLTVQRQPIPVPHGLKRKDLIGIPWRVAFSLQAAGWYLRQDVIWHKPNPMPESVRDRCTKAHEYVFLLAKSDRYFFDAEAISDVAVTAGKVNLGFSPERAESMGRSASGNERTGGRDLVGGETRNRRSVWSISTHSYRGAHFATYPPRLVEPCILAGTSAAGCCPTCGAQWRRVTEKNRVATRPGEGSKVNGRETIEVGNRDPQRHVTQTITTGWAAACKCPAHEPIPCTVLDPFLGSGTTAAVAEYLGRRWIGCELNEEYAELARQRIAEGYRPKAKSTGRKKRRKSGRCEMYAASLFDGGDE